MLESGPDPAARKGVSRPMNRPTSDLVIETNGLRKVYRSGGRRNVAVDGLDLSVPAGGVHGFLGPNGSGKTTTIKMLLGLDPPHQGRDAAVRPPGAGPAAPGHRPRRRDRRGAALRPDVLRTQEPLPARPLDRRAAHDGRRGAAAGRSGGPRAGALRRLLARHEAAAGHRRRPAEEPRPADPRRADQRSRPRRHPRDPRPDPRPRRVRRDRAAELAHPRRGAAGVPLGLDRRRGTAARERTRRGPARRERLPHPRRRHRPAGRAPLPGGRRLHGRRDRRPAGRRGARAPRRDHPAAGRQGRLRQRAVRDPAHPRVLLPQAHRPPAGGRAGVAAENASTDEEAS